MLAASDSQRPDVACWQAELRLRFALLQGRTVLAARSHCGPLQVQRAFYPEAVNGACHVYILHPPGGVVAGDRLTIQAEVGSGAQVLLTTPAAGKFYRSDGLEARAQQDLRIGAGAALEWFPQENIIFDGARVTIKTHVELEADSQFMGWEITCLGRPAGRQHYRQGDCRQSFEIWRNGHPLWIERSHYAGGSPALTEAWGMAGYPVTGSLVCVTKQTGLLHEINDIINEQFQAEALCSITQLDEMLVARYLGRHAEEAKRYFTQVWQLVRPVLLARPACVPRIWNS